MHSSLLYVRGCPRDFSADCSVCEICGAHNSVNIDSNFVGFGAVTDISSSHAPIFGAVTDISSSHAPIFGAVTDISSSHAPIFGAVTDISSSHAPIFRVTQLKALKAKAQ
jgi:hypothetical protein